MFKERLKISLKKSGSILGEILLLVLVVASLIGLAILVVEYPIVGYIVKHVVCSILGIGGLFILLFLALSAYEFINWLFVEPYKESKKKRNEN